VISVTFGAAIYGFEASVEFVLKIVSESWLLLMLLSNAAISIGHYLVSAAE
jgi:flagellar assembly factor FliW